MLRVTVLISLVIFIFVVRLKAENEVEVEVEMETTTRAEVEYLGYVSPEQNSETRVRILKEIDVAQLEDVCNIRGECPGFVYEDPSEVAFFQAKPAVCFPLECNYELKKPPQFDTLKFMDSKFVNFPMNLFYSVNIEELDIRNCSIQSLSWDNFLMADKLSILMLSENHLTEIKPLTFNNAENLVYLFLDANYIDTLHRESFKELNSLYFLDLQDNRLESLPDNIFSYLPALQQLFLAGNRLRVISDDVFVDNPRLVFVNMQRNLIEVLGEHVFQEQEYMDYIDLSHNAPLKSLVGTMRVDNLWARNCSLSRVNIYGNAKNVDLQNNHIRELYFSRPETLESLRLSDNQLPQIASLSKATNLQFFDISNNPHLKALPEFWEADSLEKLDLSNTSLTDIPISVLLNSERLNSLNVSCNRLTHIDPGNFQYFEKLKHLYIHHNNWNCYSLQLIMDLLIKPRKISYTMDDYDDDFPGEYIGGIKCMYRLEEEEEVHEEVEINESLNEPLLARQSQTINSEDISGQSSQPTTFENESEVDILRREFKAVVGIYEQKFSHLLKKIDDLDRRLKPFEQFNQTMWRQHITISV